MENRGHKIFFRRTRLEYQNDPEKTLAGRNRHGWTTLSDVGHVDADDYLYLTDRKSFLIISGGLNIYPLEIQNILLTHPGIFDVESSEHRMRKWERGVAVVQPVDPDDANAAFAQELKAWVRGRISPMKVPRQFDFVTGLPRHSTARLNKRLLRDRYWGKAKATIF